MKLLAKAIEIKPEDARARAYADRLILGKLTEIHAAVKLSEVADSLQSHGIGLAAVRSLLASNAEKFAYVERRWVPAARVETEGRPLTQAIRTLLDRFGGPVPIKLIVTELCHVRHMTEEEAEYTIRRFASTDLETFLIGDHSLGLKNWVFAASSETVDRALALNRVNAADLAAVEAKVKDFDFRSDESIAKAVAAVAPVNIRVLGAVAWMKLNPQAPHTPQFYDWRKFNSTLLSMPGYAFGSDGTLTTEQDAKSWISSAVKLAEKLAPSVEVEDAAPIEIKAADVSKMVKQIVASDQSITATKLLEDYYEITPSIKTFPDDMANIMSALRAQSEIVWVGGDRFNKVGVAPEYVASVPELFQYVQTEFRDEEGELIDAELSDEGLTSTLRKLLTHPLASDVLDEDILPVPKQQADQLRLVLKPIHRELGTFPLCQVPSGWFDADPVIQEMIFVDSTGRELQVWANMEARLMFNLIDWFFEQPVESGAVFSLTKTTKPNVFEFEWLEQTDPVVFVTSQRMEELRNIQARSEDMSTLQILQEVMSHWPKGADFLTILWEVNVIRRSTRRLVASLLSSYACFYQRSGSPVWHYDSKKNEQGFDKTKRKFIIKK